MAIRKINPTSPGQRGMTKSDFAEITTDKAEKSLLRCLRKTAGRNNTGRITCRHKGGGNKRAYRVVDFKREKFGIPAVVKTIEYDPNRNVRISLVFYADGEKRYILTIFLIFIPLSSVKRYISNYGNRVRYRYIA